jgi:hypothetical protein
MSQLVKEIGAAIRKAKKNEMVPCFRLNLTSDMAWEKITLQGKTIFQLFPNVQFYDYTKDANRKNIPDNYDLTFSYSGVSGFSPYVSKAKAKGMRLAVVFRTLASIPVVFQGMHVVSGDNSDVRHLDDQGVIVGLYAKGAAKRDITGFVV